MHHASQTTADTRWVRQAKCLWTPSDGRTDRRKGPARKETKASYTRGARATHPMAEEEPQALREVLEGLAVSQRTPRAPSVPGDGGTTVDQTHAFWDTQPVPRLNEDTSEIDPAQMGPIDPPDMGLVRKEPYHLPPSFEWSDVDLADSEQAHELYSLL